MKLPENQNSKNKLEKEQSRKTHTSQFEILVQSYSNQNSVLWHKDRHTDQWNRI